MAQPIGVSFLPSEENAIMAPQPGAGDLSQAFKILSLRLPRVQGAPGITPQSNLQAPGAAGMGGFNPQAAIFDAMIRAMAGGQPPMSGAMPNGPGAPHITPGAGVGTQLTGMPTQAPQTPQTPFRRGPLSQDGTY